MGHRQQCLTSLSNPVENQNELSSQASNLRSKVWLHHSETPASDPSDPSGPQTSVSTIAFQILLRDEHPHQVNHRVAGNFDLYTINTLLMVEIVLSNAFKWSYRIWKWVVEPCFCVSHSQDWNPFSIPTYCIPSTG